MSQQLWEVKIPSSSVSFKLWVSLTPTLNCSGGTCTLYRIPQLQFCQEPRGRGGTGKFM